MNEGVKSHSNTRWWSEFEECAQLYRLFEKLEALLGALADASVGPQTVSKCKELLQNPRLRQELAVLVDAGHLLTTTTYLLEGDGFVAVQAFSKIQAVLAHCRVFGHPELTRVANSQGANPADVDEIIEYGLARVRPCFTYLEEKFTTDPALRAALSVFEGVSLLNPALIRGRDETTINRLLDKLPGIDAVQRQQLLQELPLFIERATPFSNGDVELSSIEEFWRTGNTKFPFWSRLAYRCMLYVPTSAAVERVFSMLGSMFNDCQEHAKQDYIQAAIMKRYNTLWREKLNQPHAVDDVVNKE